MQFYMANWYSFDNDNNSQSLFGCLHFFPISDFPFSKYFLSERKSPANISIEEILSLQLISENTNTP